MKAASLIVVGSLWAGSALALDSSLDVAQYGHTAWRLRDGFSKGVPTTFAQTPDGYLWLGSDFGLLRFDGVRTTPWVPPGGAALTSDRVRALASARDGTLWIGTLSGVAAWNGTTLRTIPELDGSIINALLVDREGTVWVGTSTFGKTGLLCAIRGTATECQGRDGRFGIGVSALYEQANGALWATSGLDRVWRLTPGPARAYPVPATIASLGLLAETDSGTIVVGTQAGVHEIAEPRVQPYPLRDTGGEPRVSTILRDRDGSLWIGTRNVGLLHVHRGRTDVFTRADGLSGDQIHRLFEDREGNIWVATDGGIDRFRALAVITHLETRVGAVLAARDGRVWVSTDSVLKRWDRDGLTEVKVRGLPKVPWASLFEDSRGRIWVASQTSFGYLQAGSYTAVEGAPQGYFDSFAEDTNGNVWASYRETAALSGGLLRIARNGRIDVPLRNDNNQIGRRLAADPLRGGIWMGYYTGGLAHLIDGRAVISYSARDGLGKGSVNQLRVTADGTVWAATEGGLSRLKNGRIATLDTRGGLPCDVVHWMIEDAQHAWWLYTTCGLVRLASSELDAWAAAVDAGTAPRRVATTVLDGSDGVRAMVTPASYSPQAARSADGKLLFVSRESLTVLDPQALRPNPRPPPVHVESIVADRKAYEPTSGVRLPALVRDVQIEYTATSLVAPEKSQFKYKLEGRDSEWNDVGNRRQAFYTDLDPGDYRFRVIAANNSGLWNEQGATLEFSVAPAYWQTWWFRVSCAAALAALLWALYRWRVRQVARRFSATLDARVAERMRIARDLHDTLLQSFHGLLLRFQTASDLLPDRATEAKQVLAGAIDQAAGAITEGRDAVQGLRSAVAQTDDLVDAIRTLGEELAANAGSDKVVLRVEVQGTPRALHPIMRDEIFRIAGEAMRNAFRHAEAKTIEVELCYEAQRLRLRVRDDGKGIDAKVLGQGGRAGHFGIPGMRERAKLIGAKLAVWSAPGLGAEIELTVPASRAYGASEAPADEKIQGHRAASER